MSLDTQGLRDMILKAKPDWKRLRAATAVRARPPPVYLKLSLNRLLSPDERASLVSRLKARSRTTTTPATPA